VICRANSDVRWADRGIVRGAADTPAVGFLSDLAAEAGGGVVTAAILGVWATRFAAVQQVRHHDDRVADLLEDNRRWFRDRDARVGIETRTAINSAGNQLYSGAMLTALQRVRRQALHDYRDEMTRKRRLYADTRSVEGWQHRLARRRRAPLARFELTDEQRAVLASWRKYTAPGSNDERPVEDDPTSQAREPDLRRFEREGDPA
jgi:hypothetical protein